MKVTLGLRDLEENAVEVPMVKPIVFGLLKRGGKVYTEIVPNCKSKILQDIIRDKVIIHTDGWGGYDWLVDIMSLLINKHSH